MTTTTDNAENQAKAQLENIQNMMARLEHAQQCNGDESCGLDADTIVEGIGYTKGGGYPEDEDREQYHDEDDARQRIDEDPLSVMVRSDWQTPGQEQEFEPVEYEILLMTGGPAVRIIGSLDQHGTPDRARLQYQDWGTPWTELFEPRDMATLVTYANTFYFGS